MATYLQGVTDFIPEIQPFQPDLNFYGGLMQAKQNQYDQNWKSINKMYGQYMYADLTREPNIERKEEYLKDIEFNLNRVAGLDLSLEQNVSQASQVFKPFYENKFLMKDMAWTKNYMRKRSRAKSLKNSMDAEMKSQYWDTGIREMDYRREEFKESNDEESMTFGNAEYTSYINVGERIEDLAIKADLNVESIDFSPDGKWVIKKTNGEAAMDPLYKIFEATLGSDPAIGAVYRTQSYVTRKDFAYNNAAQFGDSKEAAEMEYLQTSFNTLKKLNEDRVKTLEDSGRATKNKSIEVQKNIDGGNGSVESMTYLEKLKESAGINTTVLEQSKYVQKLLGTGQNTLSTSTGFENPYGDLKSLRQKVDAGMASFFMQKDMKEGAENWAFRNAGIDIEANPYKVQELKDAAAMSRVKARNTGEKLNMIQKFRLDNGIDKIDPYSGKIVENPDMHNTFFTKPRGTGQTTPPQNMFEIAEQQAKHNLENINRPLIEEYTTFFGYLEGKNLITDAEIKDLLNGTGDGTGQKPYQFGMQQADIDRVKRQEESGGGTGKGKWYDFLNKPVGNYARQAWEQNAANRQENQGTPDYETVHELNEAFTSQGVNFPAKRLEGIVNRVTSYLKENPTLTEDGGVLQQMHANLIINSDKFTVSLDNQKNYQDSKLKMAAAVERRLLDNGYNTEDINAIFDESGSQLSKFEFIEKLQADGTSRNLIERPTQRIIDGKPVTIDNNNYLYYRDLLGAKAMRASKGPFGTGRVENGFNVWNKVNKEGVLQANSTVNLYTADGKVKVLTGEPEAALWKKNIKGDSQYVTLTKSARGWFGGEHDIYEVTEENKKQIQKIVGDYQMHSPKAAASGTGLLLPKGSDDYETTYDNLITQINNVYKDGDVMKDYVSGINMYGDGNGGTGLSVNSIGNQMVIPKAYMSPGYVTMNQFSKGDFANIDWDGTNSVAALGDEPSDLNSGDLELNEKVLLAWRDFEAEFYNPLNKMKPFTIKALSIAGGNGLVGGMQVIPEKEWMESYISTLNAKGEVKEENLFTVEEGEKFMKNGFNFMSDKLNFNNNLFNSSWMDPYEQSVKYKGAAGDFYEVPNVGSFHITPSNPKETGAPWSALVKYKTWDPNIKDYRNESRPIPLHNLSMHTREVLITELFNVRKANIDLQNGR